MQVKFNIKSLLHKRIWILEEYFYVCMLNGTFFGDKVQGLSSLNFLKGSLLDVLYVSLLMFKWLGLFG